MDETSDIKKISATFFKKCLSMLISYNVCILYVYKMEENLHNHSFPLS